MGEDYAKLYARIEKKVYADSTIPLDKKEERIRERIVEICRQALENAKDPSVAQEILEFTPQNDEDVHTPRMSAARMRHRCRGSYEAFCHATMPLKQDLFAKIDNALARKSHKSPLATELDITPIINKIYSRLKDIKVPGRKRRWESGKKLQNLWMDQAVDEVKKTYQANGFIASTESAAAHDTDDEEGGHDSDTDDDEFYIKRLVLKWDDSQNPPAVYHEETPMGNARKEPHADPSAARQRLSEANGGGVEAASGGTAAGGGKRVPTPAGNRRAQSPHQPARPPANVHHQRLLDKRTQNHQPRGSRPT